MKTLEDFKNEFKQLEENKLNLDKQLMKDNIKMGIKLMIYLPVGFVAAIALLIIFATKGAAAAIVIGLVMAAGFWIIKQIWKTGLKAARKAQIEKGA